MKKLNQNGRVSVLLLPLAFFVLLTIAGAVFGVWSYGEMVDYRDNVDQKSATAVKAAESSLRKKLEAEFTEKEKQPLKTYTGPVSFGAIKVSYPKNWSSYVDLTNSSRPVNAYFHPDFVPSTGSKVKYALRIELVNTEYSRVAKEYNDKVTRGELKAVTFENSGESGIRYDGKLENETTEQW